MANYMQVVTTVDSEILRTASAASLARGLLLAFRSSSHQVASMMRATWGRSERARSRVRFREPSRPDTRV